MIEFLSGKLARLENGLAVLDVNGIGVRIRMLSTTHLRTFLRRRVTIPVSLSLSSGDPRLFGFRDMTDRDLFQSVTRLPGIGPVTAFKALESLREAKRTKSGKLAEIEGLGPAKLARIERWLKSGETPRKPVSTSKSRLVRDALVALGIPAREAGARTARALESEPQAGVEELIRLAAVK